MIKTYKSFESFCLQKKIFSDILDFSDENFEKMIKLYNTGFCIPLIERDSEGCRVIVMRLALWNQDEFPHDDLIRTIIYVTLSLLEEEETQICGVTFINDLAGITIKHLMSPAIVIRNLKLLSRAEPLRIKKIFIGKRPTIGKFLVDMILNSLKDKFKFRVKILDSMQEVASHFDQNIMPKELGGAKSYDEMLESYAKVLEERKEKVLSYLNVEIDWSKVSKERFEAEEGDGSFRKLEID
jgi:ASC-1-like (ASCH) protein